MAETIEIFRLFKGKAFGAEIQFDEIAQTPYTYHKDGSEHIVWFEDAKVLRQSGTYSRQ